MNCNVYYHYHRHEFAYKNTNESYILQYMYLGNIKKTALWL